MVPLHSGHTAPLNRDELWVDLTSRVTATSVDAEGAGLWAPLPLFWRYSSSTWAMASGQERIWRPSCQIGWGQRMPFSCLMTCCGPTPERNANEIRRAVASENEPAQPPALP